MITLGVAEIVSIDNLVVTGAPSMLPESTRKRAHREVSTSPLRLTVAATAVLVALVLPPMADATRDAVPGASIAQPQSVRRGDVTPTSVLAPSDVRREFEHLVAAWKEETSFTPSLREAFDHPCYQRIIAMGSDVVPLLLREMKRAPDHWDFALSQITGENPVSDEEGGRLDRIAAAWLEWGQSHQLT